MFVTVPGCDDDTCFRIKQSIPRLWGDAGLGNLSALAFADYITLVGVLFHVQLKTDALLKDEITDWVQNSMMDICVGFFVFLEL